MQHKVAGSVVLLLVCLVVALFYGVDWSDHQSDSVSTLRPGVATVGHVKAWTKPHFPTGWAKYTVTAKTRSNGGTSAGVEVEITGKDENGVQASTAWHVLRDAGKGAGVAHDALDEYELMDRNVGRVVSVRFRLVEEPSWKDSWDADWVEVAMGEFPAWGVAHFEPMPRVCGDCGDGKAERAEEYTVVMKIRDEAGADATGPFELRPKFVNNVPGRTDGYGPWFPMNQDFKVGETATFKWFYYPPSVVGDVDSMSFKKIGETCANGVCPDIEWIDLRVGEEKPGQVIYVQDIPKDKCENIPKWYCDFTDLKRRVKATEEEDVFHLQKQIDSLKATVDQLTYQTLWEVDAEAFAVYTFTIRTKDATPGALDILVTGTKRSTPLLRLTDDGYAVDQVAVFEYKTPALGDLVSITVKNSHWDLWKPHSIEVGVGTFPFVEEHHFTTAGGYASDKGDLVMTAPTTRSHTYDHNKEDVLVKLEGSIQITYTITVQTKVGDTTPGPVEIQLVGKTTSSDWLNLADPGVGFTDGQKEVYEFKTSSLGALQSVNVRVSHWDGWKFDYIQVGEGAYPFWDVYTFEGGDVWQDAGIINRVVVAKNTNTQVEGLQTTVDALSFQHVIPASEAGITRYTVTTETAAGKWDGTKGGDVSIVVVGEGGQTKSWVLFKAEFDVLPSSVHTLAFEDVYVGKLTSIKVTVADGGHWVPQYIQVRTGAAPSWTTDRFNPLEPRGIEKGQTVEGKAAIKYTIKITPRKAQTQPGGWQFQFETGDSDAGEKKWSDRFSLGVTSVTTEPLIVVWWSNKVFAGPGVWSAQILNMGIPDGGTSDPFDAVEIEVDDQTKKTRLHVPEFFTDTNCKPTDNKCHWWPGRGLAGAKVSRESLRASTANENDNVNTEAVQKLIDGQKGAMAALARASINTQFGIEHQTMASGSSGVVRVRAFEGGSSSYHVPSYGGRGSFLSIHEHANNIRTVGMGEFSAILNGVYFQTRHNDYALVQPSTTDGRLGAVEDIEFPPTPPSVLSAGSVAAQVTEMQEYFRAFKTQNITHRDYLPYFKPVLSYLEGYWKKHGDGTLSEPFASDRHHVEADSWDDLYGKIMFLQSSGRKNNLENLPYLPMAVKATDADGLPVFGEFTYRIVCHPIGRDIPLNRFRIAEDFHTRMAHGKKSKDDLLLHRSARFDLNQRDQDGWHYGTQKRGLMDEIMEGVAGLDNYIGNMEDTAFGVTVNHFEDKTKLNTAFYTRYYSTAASDAMGQNQRRRGFNDGNMFAAATKQPLVLGMVANQADKGKPKDEVEQKWSWAIPLEIIWLNPLWTWNPYGLTWRGKAGTTEGDLVTANKRNGDVNNINLAYDGLNSKVFYQTPAEFFETHTDNGDKADTAKGSVGVKKGSSIKIVKPSGTRIVINDIGGGVGSLRQRWPIAPVHEAGSTVWKEVEALADILLDPTTSHSQGVEFTLTTAYGHEHVVTFSAEDLAYVEHGGVRSRNSNTANGHTHTLTLMKLDITGDCPATGADGNPWTQWSHANIVAGSKLCYKMTISQEGHGVKCDC